MQPTDFKKSPIVWWKTPSHRNRQKCVVQLPVFCKVNSVCVNIENCHFRKICCPFLTSGSFGAPKSRFCAWLFTVLKMFLQILPPRSLLLLRLTMATFCIAITIVSGVLKADPRWFIYLTNWSFLLLTITMICLTLVSIISEYENFVSSTENAPQEMRNRSDIVTANAERSSSQNNAKKVESTSLAWYKKGKML